MYTVIRNDFPGISLAAARTNKRLTQKEFAKACNVSESTVVKWENGETYPSAKKLPLIEQVLEMPLNYINFGRR